jgi:hypothetical protein
VMTISSVEPKYIIEQPTLFGQAEPVGFGTPDFYVKLIDRDVANDMVRRNHYSKTVYSGTSHHFGVFLGGVLLGVLQWGAAMNPASGPSIVPGLELYEWRELNRMWIDDAAPKNTESRAISYTIKALRRIYPKLKMVQSFADERCGGLGVVYQACSFGFYGEHLSEFYEIDGEWFHKINFTTKDEKRCSTPRVKKALANADRATKHNLRQFRYLRFFSKPAERACKLERQPYPKRVAT